jgi:hypothetical protein
MVLKINNNRPFFKNLCFSKLYYEFPFHLVLLFSGRRKWILNVSKWLFTHKQFYACISTFLLFRFIQFSYIWLYFIFLWKAYYWSVRKISALLFQGSRFCFLHWKVITVNWYCTCFRLFSFFLSLLTLSFLNGWSRLKLKKHLGTWKSL